ncbi:sulfotransferase ssu-1-like [Styela clava]
MSKLPVYYAAKHPEQDGIFLMPNGSQDNIESALRYKARTRDLFLCSYPKCGVTWLQNIVWRVLHHGQPCETHLRNHISFLEFDGEDAIFKTTTGEDISVIKTHFPYHWVPKHAEAKYIFIAREPKDVCVSLFYHIKGFPDYEFDGSFDDIFEGFLEGTIDCGDYFQILMEWFAVRNDASVLFLLYEDLLSDTKNEILKIARFIGNQCEEDLTSDSEAILRKIIEETQISEMRKDDSKWVLSERSIPFIRKGVIGDWKNHMTVEQSEKIDKKLKETAKGNGCEKLWEKWQ